MTKKSTKLSDIPDESSDDEPEMYDNHILDSLINCKNNNPEEYENFIKYIIYATILFCILSLPFIDK